MSGHQPLPIDRQEPGAGQDLRLLMDRVVTFRPCSQWLPMLSRSRPGEVTTFGLVAGPLWRSSSWRSVVAHRRSSSTASVTLLDDASVRLDHAAFALPASEVPALIDSVEKAAAAADGGDDPGVHLVAGPCRRRLVSSAGTAGPRPNFLGSWRRTRGCTPPRGICTSKRSSKEQPAPGCR